ncbi:hypothetical protein [Algoriphagus machipongonensis]|uniref:hypothetical protein n=1 Tax=Algoriphagus machipongonensis TaxID=388413 RepID=UPI000310F909|nr:hypothetical protein [Algoriphagus machipongonensis]
MQQSNWGLAGISKNCFVANALDSIWDLWIKIGFGVPVDPEVCSKKEFLPSSQSLQKEKASLAKCGISTEGL